jgi:hypothetical protein
MILRYNTSRGNVVVIILVLIAAVGLGIYLFPKLTAPGGPLSTAAAPKKMGLGDTPRNLEEALQVAAALDQFYFALRHTEHGVLVFESLIQYPRNNILFYSSDIPGKPKGPRTDEDYEVVFALVPKEEKKKQSFTVHFEVGQAAGPQSPFVEFDASNYGKWTPLSAAKDPLEFTIIRKDPAMRLGPIAGQVPVEPYVFLVFNMPGALIEKNTTWVAGVTESSKGKFTLIDDDLSYAFSPSATPGNISLNLNITNWTNKAAEAKTIEFSPKQMGVWQELGPAPARNMACMLISNAAFKEMTSALAFPAPSPAIEKATKGFEQARNLASSNFFRKETTNRLGIFEIRDDYGSDPYIQNWIVLGAQGESTGGLGHLSHFDWVVKARPRLFPEYYPGQKVENAQNRFKLKDMIFTLEGKTHGNFMAAYAKAGEGAEVDPMTLAGPPPPPPPPPGQNKPRRMTIPR